MFDFKKYFELNKKYKFEVTDLTAAIYVFCAIIGIIGYNPTISFFIGAFVSTLFCWQARRINVMILNFALFILNLKNFLDLL